MNTKLNDEQYELLYDKLRVFTLEHDVEISEISKAFFLFGISCGIQIVVNEFKEIKT